MKLTLKTKKLKTLGSNKAIQLNQTPNIAGGKELTGPSLCTQYFAEGDTHSGPTRCTAL